MNLGTVTMKIAKCYLREWCDLVYLLGWTSGKLGGYQPRGDRMRIGTDSTVEMAGRAQI